MTGVTVPIFLMITGCFSYNLEAAERETQQIVKLLKMMVIANVAYVMLWTLYVMNLGQRPITYLQSLLTLRNIKFFLMFNDTLPFTHLWYICAITYTLVIVKVFKHYGIMKWLYFLTPLLLAIDLAFGKYSLLL